MKHDQRTTHHSQISVASWSHCTRSPASICVKTYFFLADLRGFYLLPYAYLQSALICVKSSLSFLADLRGYYLHPSAYLQSAPICVKSSSFLADLRGFVLRPSAWNLHFFSRWFTRIFSASICVKTYFFLADLRGFYLLPYAYLQSALICVKSSLFFSLIDADLCCAHMREVIFKILSLKFPGHIGFIC